MSDDALLTKQGHIAVVTLNRERKLNAVSPEMAAQIVDFVQDCNKDDDIRVVVLTGAGRKAFCAGSDIKELDDYPTAWKFRMRDDYCDAIRHLRKPSICLVNGYALGGGLELALSCDIRLASTNAMFCAAEIKLGWIGGGGVSYLLTHNIGASNAAYMLYTGDMVDAQNALAWNLVTRVTAPDDLLERGMALAETIASRAPLAAITAKDNLRAAYSMPLETAVQYERDLQTICMSTRDAAEGRQAFEEKRQALFRGE